MWKAALAGYSRPSFSLLLVQFRLALSKFVSGLQIVRIEDY